MTTDRRVLIVWVHGFKGDTTTFLQFPRDFTQALQLRHPTWNVQHAVYPKYETEGELKDCTQAFGRWVEKRVAFEDEWDSEFIEPTVEQDNGKELQPKDEKPCSMEGVCESELEGNGGDPSESDHSQTVVDLQIAMDGNDSDGSGKCRTDVILVGHSMGGLLVADASSIWRAAKQAAPETSGHQMEDGHERPFEIRNVIALDTPFIGIHPSLVSYGIDQLDLLFSRLQTQSSEYISQTPSFIRDTWSQFGADKWLKPPSSSMFTQDSRIVKGAQWGLGLVAKGSERGALSEMGLPGLERLREDEEQKLAREKARAERKREKEEERAKKARVKGIEKARKAEEKARKAEAKKRAKEDKRNDIHADAGEPKQGTKAANYTIDVDGGGSSDSGNSADARATDPSSPGSLDPQAVLDPPSPRLLSATTSNTSTNLCPPPLPPRKSQASGSSIPSSRTPSIVSMNEEEWDDFGAHASTGMTSAEVKRKKRKGWKWLQGHLVFVSALWRTEEVWRRMRRLEEMQRLGTRFTNIYTVVPASPNSPTPDQRTFISLPASNHPTSANWQAFEIAVPDQVTAHMALFMKDKNKRYDVLIDTIMDEIDASVL